MIIIACPTCPLKIEIPRGVFPYQSFASIKAPREISSIELMVAATYAA